MIIDIVDIERDVVLCNVEKTIIEDIARHALDENLDTSNIKIIVKLDKEECFIYQKSSVYIVNLEHGRLTDSIPGFSFSTAYCDALLNKIIVAGN